jgi:putative membrane protein
MDYDDPQLQEAYYVITNAENKIGVVKILGYLDIFMMVALFFSLIVFCVRVTNVRSFLFGIVFSHVLALLLAILSIITVFALGGNSVAWLYILTAYLMIFASVYLLGHISKLHSAILINFSLIVFVPASYSTLLLIEGRLLPSGLPNNYVILAATFVFIYFYSRVLHQWKAGAE